MNNELKAWIDGSCEPFNPGGTASYGLVVQRGNIEIYTASGIVGNGKDMSNNVAEYSALKELIRWYRANHLQELITIYSDSQLLVKQMNREWKVRGGLYFPFWDYCRMAIDALGSENFQFIWVPREQNWKADNLSREALMKEGIKPRGK